MATFNQIINVTMLDTFLSSKQPTRTTWTQFNNEFNQIVTHFNVSPNTAFDIIVLQTVQRLGRNISEPITIASTGQPYTTPGNPSPPNLRLNVGND